MQDLKVAIIQTSQYWEAKKENLAHFSSQLKSSLVESVDLILLPEMFNTSFTMNVAAMAESMHGESLQWLKQLAAKYNCSVGATLIIIEGGLYYNRFVLVSEDGTVEQYDKRHLFRMAKENNHFTAGKNRVVVQLKGWNLLLQVCYDLRFPVFSRNKTIGETKEYDALVYLANWPEKRNNAWKTLLQARAIENQAFCIGVNRVGLDGNGINYSGDSMIIDPWGAIEYQFQENHENVKILTLEAKKLSNIARLFPAFKDAD